MPSDEGQFVVYFQPQMNGLGEVVGCEALVRWATSLSEAC